MGITDEVQFKCLTLFSPIGAWVQLKIIRKNIHFHYLILFICVFSGRT